jgi:hypothetical protein
MFTDVPSPGKKHNMQKRVTNKDEFEKDVVLRRTIFRFYDKGEFPRANNFSLEFRDKINYSGSVSLMYKIKKKTLGSNTAKPTMDVNFLWEVQTLCLLE